MNKFILLITLAASAFALSGCTSDYVMSSKDGNMVVSHGKPIIDKETGMISYTDQDGNQHEIKRDSITQIVEK